MRRPGIVLAVSMLRRLTLAKGKVLSVHLTEVSKWLVAQWQCGCAVSVVGYRKLAANIVQGSRAASQAKICVVTEVSTFLIDSIVKKSHIPIFGKCKYIPSCLDSWFGHCKILCHHRSHFVMAGIWPCIAKTSGKHSILWLFLTFIYCTLLFSLHLGYNFFYALILWQHSPTCLCHAFIAQHWTIRSAHILVWSSFKSLYFPTCYNHKKE